MKNTKWNEIDRESAYYYQYEMNFRGDFALNTNPISTKIVDVLVSGMLTKNEMRVLLEMASNYHKCKVYYNDDYQPTDWWIDYNVFNNSIFKNLNMDRTSVFKVLKSLINKNILIKHNNKIIINENHNEWLKKSVIDTFKGIE